MKEAYQLYFGTPMGGIPSAPIPVTLPNVTEKEPGEKAEIWWFDGSPMSGTGDWKLAGLGTVSDDGKTVSSDPGVGIPRFCGVCGLFSLGCPPPPITPQEPPCPTCPQPPDSPSNTAGNPVGLFTGQERASSSGLSLGGLQPVQTGLSYSPIDAFNNRAGTVTSFGYGWTFNYDISFWPMSGVQKRLVMPGGQYTNMVDDGSGKYRTAADPRYDGAYAQYVVGTGWEIVFKGGAKWQFEPFAGINGFIRGGPPLFVTKMIDSNGNTTVISRQSNGRIQTISGSDGRGINLSYGSNGFVSRMTDHTGRHQDYEYTQENRVNKVTDAQGRVTQYTYQAVPTYTNSSTGQTACAAELPESSFRGISSVLYPTSSTPTVNTYATDRIVKQTTSKGETWKFAYRRTGACVVKLSANSTLNADASANNVWDYTCRAGQSLANRKCAGGSCTTTEIGTCPDTDSEDSRAAGWRFYGGTVQETVVIQPNGATTRSKFNARGMITETVDELGQRKQFTYDPQQRLTKVVDALGRETKYEYDSLGNRTAVVDALGHRVETTYNAKLNRPSQTTRFWKEMPSTQGGVQLSYTPLFSTISYDSAGNPIQTTDEVGLQSNTSYNANGQVEAIRAAAQKTASSIPVVNAGVASTLNPNSRQTTLGYNNAGDLIVMTDAQGNESRISVDALGRASTTTNPLGYSSQTQYNALDQATQTTNALNQTESTTYDAAGRITAIHNAAGVAIERYSYDPQGRLVRKTDALNNSDHYEYDSFNRLVKTTDRKGQVSTITYNERSQISSVNNPERSISYQYDSAGRLSETRDASSVTSYQYDAINRIVQTDTSTAAGSHRLAYQYDSLGRITQKTLSGTGIATPQTTSYTWDAADRLLGHSTTVGGVAHTSSYSYDAAGRVAARKVQTSNPQAGSQSDLITQRYGYDTLDRLSQIKYIKAEGTANEQRIEQIDYTYDAAGQRTSKTTLNGNGTGGAETPMSATFDAANRMTSITLNVGTATATAPQTYTLSYDANGNLTKKQNNADAADNTVYTWDANNRLTQIAQSGSTALTASYLYDAAGRRIQSTMTRAGQSASTVQYLYEGAQALGEIRDGQLSHRLLTGLSLDETIARVALNTNGQKDAAASRIYLTDALSSVIAQLGDDSSASLQNSYAYSPYGQSSTVGPDATNNPNQYTSRENDNTGLYYYRARYYDPVLKRFISSDPLGLGGGMNVFAYVEGNPVSNIDPMGLLSITACANPANAAACIEAGIISPIVCTTNDGNDSCDIILDKGQLKSAGIRGREHEVKQDALGSNKNLSKFDLCGCKDGRVVVKFHGCKGPIIETTDYRWK